MNNFISHAFANLLRGELHSFLLKNNSKSKKNKNKNKKKQKQKKTWKTNWFRYNWPYWPYCSLKKIQTDELE